MDEKIMIIIDLHKCYSPIEEGGIVIRSIKTLDEVTNLKQCWDMVNSEDHWARLLRDKVLRDKGHIKHHIFSSIWNGTKCSFTELRHNTSWLIRDGRRVNLWLDCWNGAPLVESLNIPDWIHLKTKFNSDILHH